MNTELFQEKSVTFPNSGRNYSGLCLALAHVLNLSLKYVDEGCPAVLLTKFKEELFMTLDNDNKAGVTETEPECASTAPGPGVIVTPVAFSTTQVRVEAAPDWMAAGFALNCRMRN